MSAPRSAQEQRLDAAVAEYEAAREAGTPLDREELLRRYPDIQPQLDEYLSNHNFAARMGASLRLAFGSLPLSFGRYQLREVIGRGGMGVVFRARDTLLERTVALKTIDRPLASALDLARFRLEAQTAASLRHPSIVPVYDVGVHEGQPYYTMALVEGPSLQAQLAAFQGRPREAAAFVASVAEAIDDAHKAGIVHRDLKPANILLDGAGKPLITDFGLAKKMDRAAEPLTSDGDVFGTAEYMSPEQAAGQMGKVGVGSDVYSLSVILYLLLCGRHPIAGANRNETLRLVLTQEPPPPRAPDGRPVDPDLAAICLHGLHKDAGARYPDAAALAADLRRWLAGEPVRARRSGTGRRLWRLVRRHPSRALIAVLLAVVAATAFYLFAARSGRRQEILESNLYTARQVGRELLERIQHWGEQVAAAASSPELADLAAAWQSSSAARRAVGYREITALPEQRRLQAACEQLARNADAALENWNLLDAHGVLVARTPQHPIIGHPFARRDYFAGTLAHTGKAGLPSVHVSTVYRSQADGLYKFDISAPLSSPDGHLLGVLAVSVTTGPDLGLVHLHDQRRKAMLLAPLDHPDPVAAPDRSTALPETTTPAGPSTAVAEATTPAAPFDSGARPHVILLHPAYAPRAPAIELDRSITGISFPRRCDEELSAATLDRAIARRLDYRTGPAFTGRWLAGLAPVGNTGFIVVIQQPDL